MITELVVSLLSPGTVWDAVALLASAAAKGVLVVVAALVVAHLLRGAAASSRHLVWTLAIAALLALPALVALLPARRLEVLPEGWSRLTTEVRVDGPVTDTVGVPHLAGHAAPAPSGEHHTLVTTVATSAHAAAPEGVHVRSHAGHAVTVERVTVTEATAVPDGEDAATFVGFSLSTLPALLDPSGSWGARLLVAWLAGVLFVLGRLALGMLRVRQAGLRARPLTGGMAAEVLPALAAWSGVTRRVTLLEGEDGRTMPLTWGVLRPRILLPAAHREWPAARLKAVLLHELAHVRRLDCLAQVAAEAACALHWFNPLAWMAARQLRLEAEHACDDHVLAAGARPSDYAGHLLELARLFRTPSSMDAPAVAVARPAQLRTRLLAVLAEERRRGPVSERAALLALVAAAALVVPLAATGLAARESHPEAFAPEAPHAGAAVTVDTVVTTVATTTTRSRAAAVVAAAPCPTWNGRGSYSHTDLVDDRGRWTVSWRMRGCEGNARIEGRVVMSADGHDVARVEPGGLLRLEMRDARGHREVVLRPGPGGRPQRTWRVEGRERPWSAEAGAWLAESLPELMERTTYGSEAHGRR